MGEEDDSKGAADGKARLKSIIDLSDHSMEDEINRLERKPWTSIVITNRALKIEQTCVSLNSEFQST